MSKNTKNKTKENKMSELKTIVYEMIESTTGGESERVADFMLPMVLSGIRVAHDYLKTNSLEKLGDELEEIIKDNLGGK